ncbi:MAG: response regulator [Candidatus Omnitrophica bacterium]|nr:response regulator [Candidatus Omnitrophota bacterium]
MKNAKRILIVDDEKMLHTMLKTVLEVHGFEVIDAMSGEEGLLKAFSEKPDLIILDELMPGIKGRDVCKKLKTINETKNIPVIFLTSKDSSDDLEAEISAGAVAHIGKPVYAATLIRHVRKVLGQ